MQLRPLVALLAAAFAAPAALAAGEVVISQVYSAGGNANAVYRNDYVELHNRGDAEVDLAGWSLQYASASGTGGFGSSNTQIALLSGKVQPGQFFLIRLASGGSAGVALPTADLSPDNINMSGTGGKIALVKQTDPLGCNGNTATPCSTDQMAKVADLVGFGNANFFEGAGAAPAPSAANAIFRAANGCTDTNVNSADFAAAAAAPRNTASPVSLCVAAAKPIVTTCTDANLVVGSAATHSVTATDQDSRVNGILAEGTTLPAGVTLGAFSAATVDGGTATQVLDIAGSLSVGPHAVTLNWKNDESQTASCTFNINVSGLVSIPSIQGSGAKSPLQGSTVTTSGVVTRLMSNGFYLQDPVGDGDPTTSDGIFVFTSTAPTVSVGQAVRLSGTVTEFNTGAAGNADTLAHTVTELTSVSGITVTGTGSVTPVEVDLATLPADGLEAYEGMVVTLRGPLTAQQNYFLGRFGQVTLAAGGRVYTPTNVHPVGPDALALQADNARRSILLDDGTTAQNVNPVPYLGADNTLRAGDTTGSITGVIDYGLATATNTEFGMYKIHPLNVAGVAFDRTNPRVATPQVSGGNVRIASANVLNFFTSLVNGSVAAGSGASPGCTLGGSTSNANCRGANNQAEFDRQIAKTLNELAALNADVVGLMEIQNNGNTTVDYLVNRLNAKLGGTVYASVPLPALTGTDAIRVAMIYKPGKLTLNGATLSDGDAVNNRPTLAQGFTLANGEKFAVVVNHLKSKGSCPGAGDSDAAGNTDDGLQGCWNALRVAQANRLKSFVGTVKSTAGTDNVVLLGDFNSYAKEDPILALTGDGSIIDAVGTFEPLDYSYVFDGGAGRLDHGLVSAGLLSKVVYATSWHINADEPSFIDYNTEFKVYGSTTTGSPDLYTDKPYRSSDHDPMVMGLNLVKSISGTSGNDTIVGTDGDDVIEGGLGRDTLTGKGGNNQFVYRTGADGLDTITDFKPGQDTLVFTDLLKTVGITSATPLATGHITCVNQADGALIGYDPDGAAGSAASRPVVKLKAVLCNAISAASFKF